MKQEEKSLIKEISPEKFSLFWQQSTNCPIFTSDKGQQLDFDDTRLIMTV